MHSVKAGDHSNLELDSGMRIAVAFVGSLSVAIAAAVAAVGFGTAKIAVAAATVAAGLVVVAIAVVVVAVQMCFLRRTQSSLHRW